MVAGGRALAQLWRHDSVDAPHLLLGMLGAPRPQRMPVLTRWPAVTRGSADRAAVRCANVGGPTDPVQQGRQDDHEAVDRQVHQDREPDHRQRSISRWRVLIPTSCRRCEPSSAARADDPGRGAQRGALIGAIAGRSQPAARDRTRRPATEPAATRRAELPARERSTSPPSSRVSMRAVLLDPPYGVQRLKIGDVLGMLPTLGPEAPGKLLKECDMSPSDDHRRALRAAAGTGPRAPAA